MIIAVTGGTGFVGRRFIESAVAQGHHVRALARRPQPELHGVEWIAGDLAAPGSLCTGADAVVHIAGVINARTRAAFNAGNVDGTRSLLEAARSAGIRRFVHMSSLAAREPGLSAYGASKAAAEALVRASELDWIIVRPPGVYGPGDRETLTMFRLAARGIALVPGHGRAAWIHVDDLGSAVLAVAHGAVTRAMFEVDDGHPNGYAHAEFARLIGEAVGCPQRVIRVPAAGLRLGAALDTALARLRGRAPQLSFDRASYLAHPDWVARGPRPPGWHPRIPAAHGLAATASWYRDAGWL